MREGKGGTSSVLLACCSCQHRSRNDPFTLESIVDWFSRILSVFGTSLVPTARSPHLRVPSPRSPGPLWVL